MESTGYESLIRDRINQNLLKVKFESRDVKHLLSLGVQSSKPISDEFDEESLQDALNQINLSARFTSRKDLLRTCILLGTSRNTQAQENLIKVISLKLGTIKEKDYRYMADMIYYRESEVVDKINAFLSYYIDGFRDLYKKFYNEYYAF